MKCGEEIRIADMLGSVNTRFIAQCNGWFLVVDNKQNSYINGYRLPNWQSVMREMVAMTVPVALVEKTMYVESSTKGMYNRLPLSYPLSVKGLADILDVPGEEVSAELTDILVPIAD
jgi:hypothetical protein